MIKIAAVDFDGTIVENRYPEVGKTRPNAKEGMQFLRDQGFSIVIWTCRDQDGQREAREFLDARGIPYDYVNENDPRVKSFIPVPPYPKVYASLYIDDSCWPPFPGWRFLVDNFEKLGMPHEFDFETFFEDSFWDQGDR